MFGKRELQIRSDRQGVKKNIQSSKGEKEKKGG